MTDPTRPPSGVYLPRKIEAIESFLGFVRGEEFPRFPLEVFLEISNVCDLACVMCPTFSALNPDRKTAIRMHDPGFMEVDEILSTAGPLLERALVIHAFGYGEPTIHPSFPGLLTRLSKYEALIDFITNGMHLTDALVERLVDLSIHHVTVSCSGSTAREYESVYQGGKFETLLAGLSRLRDLKRSRGCQFPRVHIHSLSFEHHLQHLDDFVELMSDHGVDEIEVTPLVESPELPVLAGHAAGIETDEIQSRVAKAGDVAAARGVRLFVHPDLLSHAAAGSNRRETAAPRVPIDQFPGMAASLPERPVLPVIPDPPALDSRQDSVDEMRRRLGVGRAGPTSFVCLEPFKTVYLRRGGQVKTCCYMRDDSPGLGNARSDPVEQIWNGVPYRLFRSSVLAGQYPDRACGSCLGSRLAPEGHMLEKILTDYVLWNPSARDYPFDHHTRCMLASARTGEIIADRHWSRRPGDCAAPGSTDRLSKLLALLEDVKALEEPNTALVEGWVDHCSSRGVAGWVWSPIYPDLRLPVSVWRNGEKIASLIASQLRPDLARLQKGDGRFGFAFAFDRDTPWKSDVGVRVVLEGTQCELPWVQGPESGGDPVSVAAGST
ncbi:MAG TPA: radical SAM/SPASM domain-containing protein [Thermoanaerobaculia bacterium]|nr:radical SAM/SPASM domain-containing protein [Thermoanaerobaculia bacterium]